MQNKKKISILKFLNYIFEGVKTNDNDRQKKLKQFVQILLGANNYLFGSLSFNQLFAFFLFLYLIFESQWIVWWPDGDEDDYLGEKNFVKIKLFFSDDKKLEMSTGAWNIQKKNYLGKRIERQMN